MVDYIKIRLLKLTRISELCYDMAVAGINMHISNTIENERVLKQLNIIKQRNNLDIV